jgi:hypothetical protein
MTVELEHKQGLRAVVRLVKDAQVCLDNAIQELRLRELGRFGWAMGSIGAARSAVKFAVHMIEGFIKLGDEPKEGHIA